MQRLLVFFLLCLTLVSGNSPSIKWGQSKSQLFLTFGLPCTPSEENTRVSGDEFWFECGIYSLQVVLRGSCTAVVCKSNPQTQSVGCVLTKKEQRLWDRLTQNEKDLDRFRGRLSIDYRRWEEPNDDENAKEHTYAHSSSVRSLESDAEFRKVLDSHPLVVADLSMKWCTLCVDKVKHVLSAARSMKKDAYFVHLDTQEARNARAQYNVTCSSDCSILWVFAKNEEPQRITQGKEDVEKMVRAYISPPMTHFVDINAYNTFQNLPGHSIVGVFVGDPEFTEFGKLAKAMRGSESRFGFQFGRAGQEAFGIPGAVVPCLISKSENGTEILTDLSASSMSDFIKTRNLPLFPSFDYTFRPKVENLVLSNGKHFPIAYYWTPFPLLEPEFLQKPKDWNEEQDGEWEAEQHVPSEIVDLAKEFRSQVYFVRAESYALKEFGLQENVYPAFGVASTAAYEPPARFALPLQGAKLTPEAIRNFVIDVLQQKLSPSVRSAALPTTPWTPGAIEEVVANNVEEVIRSQYDVLVFLPGWKKDEKVKANASITLVAQSLATVPEVKVVTMDVEANYVNPELFPRTGKYSPTPSLFLFAEPEEGGNKSSTQYTGKMGQSEVLVWLKKNSPRVAQKWDHVKAQAKKMKEEITAVRAKLRAEQEAETQRVASLPKIDLSGDGGVIKQTLQQGEGGVPPPGVTVHAHYTGTLLNGEQFDSSRDKGSTLPFELGAGGVIKCWDIAFASMQKGERALLTCLPSYAYGETAAGTIPAGSTLRFDVELVAFDAPQTSHSEL